MAGASAVQSTTQPAGPWPRAVTGRSLRWVGLGLLPLALCGCATVAMTALGVGASAGVNHTANGVSTRTFTAGTPQVRSASLAALNRMGISVTAIDQQGGVEVIRAKSADRQIEVELESMNKATTQMRASAKHNFFVYDAATAKEIVEQTERAMTGAPERRVKVGAVAAQAPTLRTAAVLDR
jgi:Protein of unknown function (DUF3568)